MGEVRRADGLAVELEADGAWIVGYGDGVGPMGEDELVWLMAVAIPTVLAEMRKVPSDGHERVQAPPPVNGQITIDEVLDEPDVLS